MSAVGNQSNQAKQAGVPPSQSPDSGGKDAKGVADLPWSVIMSVLGLLLLGIAYSSGDAYYNAYLHGFSVDASGFPIDKSRHLVLAVWSALKASIGFQHWVGANKKFIFQMFVVTFLYIIFWVSVDWVGDWLKSRAKKKALTGVPFVKRRPYVSKILIMLFWVCFGVANVSVLGMFVPALIAIPSTIGESVGDSVAAEMKRDFDKGCEQSTERCQVLIKDRKELARGYVVTQSASRVALYLDHNVRQMLLDGAELRTLDRSVAPATEKK